MKYEYQDIILKEIIKELGNKLDIESFKTATLNVYSYKYGQFEQILPTKHKSTNEPNIHIHIAQGSLFGISDKQGSSYSIDFTIYEFDYPQGYNNHILCNLDII